MKRYLPVFSLILILVLTAISGAIHGRMSDRWGPPRDSRAAAEKLLDLPNQFGSWRLQSSDKLSDVIEETLQCVGYLFRTYANQETGEVVTVTILLGPPGPISVHTPEICFSSRAYEIREERQKVTIRDSEGAEEEFWALTFRSNNLDAETLRVYYAWSTGGRWMAAQRPRFTFAGAPYLYKVQMAGHLPPQANPQAGDPCRRFLQDFLPVAKRCLVEPPTD